MKMLCTNGVKAVTVELIPQVQRETGLAIAAVYGSTQLLMDKIGEGETGDIALLSAEAIDELIGQRVIAAGSRVDIARSSIGVAMRRGMLAPDVSTIEALRRVLLGAKSVLHSKTGISGQYMPTLFERLGIAREIAAKAVVPAYGTVGEALARGEAEIALQQISELLPVPGVKVIGPLPEEVQLLTTFSAGTFADAEEPRAVRMLLERFTGNAARPLYARNGLAPAF